MKNVLLFISVTAVIGGTALVGQEADSRKIGNPEVAPVSYSTSQTSFSPSDMKTLGVLRNGQTATLVSSSASQPEYRAFVFEGNGNDQVDITVTGANRKAYVALADDTLTPIASGIGSLTATLPNHGPATEAFYILIKGSPNQRLAVHLKNTPASTQSPDATR